MFFLYPLFISLLVIGVTYVAYAFVVVLNARKKLSWIPAAPRVPILGSIFEFGDTTETLNDITRLINNSSKLFYMEILTIWGIIVQDHDFMEFIMSSNAILNKSGEYEFFGDWLGTGLLTASGTKWKKRRRVITPAFHFSILEQFVDVFESNGKVLIQKLSDEAVDKESVDIYTYITACALDIISESAMGVNVNTQQNKNQEYVFAVKDMCRINVARMTSTWRRFMIFFRFTEDYHKKQKYLKILHDFTNSVIEERKRELQNKIPNNNIQVDDLGRKRKLAFLDLLLNSTIDGQPLSQEDIREEVDTFMFEGHDTTASAISSTLYLLAKHQDVQGSFLCYDLGYVYYVAFCLCWGPGLGLLVFFLGSPRQGQCVEHYPVDSARGSYHHAETWLAVGAPELQLTTRSTNVYSVEKQAREEQKKIFGNDRDAPTRHQDLQDMKYLEMVIKETLRLIPSVPIIGRRLNHDIEYKGHIIPKWTIVNLFIYGINRDPDYHDSPEEFRPERFLDNGKLPFSYVPFSAGPRNCIGQKFAMLEMKSIISKVLRHFELYPTNPEHEMIFINEAVLKSSNGVKIMLKKHNWSE